jgi:hypothetical protein
MTSAVAKSWRLKIQTGRSRTCGQNSTSISASWQGSAAASASIRGLQFGRGGQAYTFAARAVSTERVSAGAPASGADALRVVALILYATGAC